VLAVASRRPAGLNATPLTGPLCPTVTTALPLRVSQTMAVAARLLVTRRRPWG
jgi:hypothetical protein